MYYQYFGLQEPPFSIAVNPRYLYMSPRHRDALAHLLYGVGAGGGFILLTGEVGTGKTTLNRCLIEQLPDNADVAIVLNPALDSRDLLATVCEELKIALPKSSSRPSLKRLTDALHKFLLDNHARGRKTVLMIDEAQHLDFEVLEQIRLLTNLETHEEKLLHIILIGQPELGEKLRRPELRQLNQRITARYDLQPLTAQETGAYIRHRLQVAGLPGGRELFPAALTRRIHRRSRGVPRLINLLCDRMLLGAYGQGSANLDGALLRSAAREVLGEAPPRRPWMRAVLPAMALAAALLVAAALWLTLAGPERPTAAPTTAAPVPDTAPAVPAIAAAPPPTPTEPAWQLAPDTGTRLLAALHDASAQGADPCAALADSTLRCERGEAATWDALLAAGRPALLELRDERRFGARALFLGLEGERVVAADQGGPLDAATEAVAARWTGRYWYYWRRPDVGALPLGPGDSGPGVAQIANWFATLDGQDRPLAAQQYSGALAERVRLFQRRAGLQEDGVVGEQTLRALVLEVGVDLDLDSARARVAARSSAGQWP